MIDDLDYDYDGNRLINVKDATAHSDGFDDGNKHTQTNKDDFEYDDYGNMIVDRNKEITNITYNHLNLPKKITFENNQSIEYIYGADGSKLRKKVTDGTKNKTIDYLSSYQYTNEILEFFPTAEGYVRAVSTSIGGGTSTYSFHYIYNYTDHLGNIRVRYTKDPQTGTIKPLEENHYYPFGLKHQGYNTQHQVFAFDQRVGNVTLINIPEDAGDGYKYKLNSREWQNEFDLNIYAMDLRHYDPAIGRWKVQDPVVHFDFSPYSAFDNNPVFWADPSGADAISLIQDLWDSTPEGTNSYWINNEGDDSNQEEQPKHQFYGITPTEDLMSLNFEGNFRTLTGFGEDPEDIRKSKVFALASLLRTLSIEDQVKIFRFLKIPKKHWARLLKAVKMGPASIMPDYNVYDEGFAALPLGLGAIFQPLNNDRDSGARLIENMNMWDNVRGGYNALMNTKILNDVIIIYSNVNLYNQSNINTNQAEALNSRYPTGTYKYVYYGTQYGGTLYIFGSYEINN